jgi:hypothetical protein
MTRRHKNAARLQCLEPYAELCDLITQWVTRDMAEAAGALGYPHQSLQAVNIRVLASSIDPTGYSAQDHAAVANAVNALSLADEKLFAAVAMYYKPWMIPAMVERGHPQAPDQTFYNRLVRAHAWLQSEVDANQPQKATQYA